MIGRIQGILLEITPPDIVVDVQGIGYELQVPMNTLYRLPEIGAPVKLFTHFVVREDAQLLYGFSEPGERSLFRELIKINGVGPKLGLTILSGIEANVFVRVVRSNDVASLERLPGIGKKTAERLIIEMRDRLKDWREEEASEANETIQHTDFLRMNKASREAESALVALGYKPKEAIQAIKALSADGLSSQELIRQALKQMVNA
jgi:Holliday junction DNA helicase RuvA